MSHQPDNIFAGTQVVSLIEVRGTNNAIVHPRGAVGVVTRTPTVAGENFLVRFPDGFETTLERSQLQMLKQFKDRLGALTERDLVQSPNDFELESFVIYRCVIGSRAMGWTTTSRTPTAAAIYLPPAELHWSLYGVPEQLEDDATQKATGSCRSSWCWRSRRTRTCWSASTRRWSRRRRRWPRSCSAMRSIFLSQLVYQTYNGYVMSQFKKMQADLRNQGEVKWKHVMHLIRLLLSGIGRAARGLRAGAGGGASRPTAGDQARRGAVGGSRGLAASDCTSEFDARSPRRRRCPSGRTTKRPTRS